MYKIVVFLLIPEVLCISGSFTRSLKFGLKKEVVKGKFYVIPEEKIVFEVDSPIHQFLTFKADTMILYYPEDSVAFKIRSSLTFSSTGLNYVKYDFGKKLKEHGFVFLKKEIKGDTTKHFWAHPDSKISVSFSIVNKLIQSFTVESDKGDTLLLLNIGDYLFLGDSINFPTYIRTVSNDFSEEIFLNDIKLVEPPDFIINFRIPKGVKIVKKGWE